MITLGTFNMRFDTPMDGANRFSNRKALIIQQFLKDRPTIIGLQEVTGPMLAALKEALPQYEFIGHGREKDFKGEHCAIAYVRDELQLHATDTFWLSPTPKTPASRYPDQSDCPRVCTWGRFYHPKTKRLFTFYNTHLDHIGAPAREKGLGQVLTFVEEELKSWPIPFFIVGDFNFTPKNGEYALIENSPLKIRDISTGPAFTFHGFGQTKNAEKIDYILTSVADGPFPLTYWEKDEQGRFLSDHIGLMTQWK